MEPATGMIDRRVLPPLSKGVLHRADGGFEAKEIFHFLAVDEQHSLSQFHKNKARANRLGG
jgi:hypothetical protein